MAQFFFFNNLFILTQIETIKFTMYSIRENEEEREEKKGKKELKYTLKSYARIVNMIIIKLLNVGLCIPNVKCVFNQKLMTINNQFTKKKTILHQ